MPLRSQKKLPTRKSPRVADRGVKAKGTSLTGQRIALGVSGGIASVEVVKIIRELRRYGATVKVFISSEAKRFITELPLEWASGETVVAEASAEVEYLEKFDAVLIAPATLNTIAKAATGICDTAITLLLASQWNEAPIFFVPTMNGQMLRHPLFPEYQRRLEEFGARFFPLQEEENRLKLPQPERLAEWLISELRSRGN